MLAPWKKSCDKPRQCTKKQRYHFAHKNYIQSYGFSSSHGQMWEMDHKEGRVLKNWCFWTVVLEKTLESPLESKKIKPVNPKGNQSWIFIGRTDAEAPILQPPDVKSSSLEKTLCWERLKQKEEGTTEDEMAGWQYWINGPEFEQTLEMVKDRKAWCATVHGLTKPWRLLSNWTAMTAGLMFTSHHTVSSMRQSWTCATCDHSDQYLSNCTGPPDVFRLRESSALDFSLGRRTVVWVV